MDNSPNSRGNGMGPRDQLSSYDPAPESIHGSDSLPNPPQRGPEAIGRHIDSMMASQSPLGTNTNPKIKLSPLVQVLIALGIVALIPRRSLPRRSVCLNWLHPQPQPHLKNRYRIPFMRIFPLRLPAMFLKRYAITWFPATLPQHLGLCLVYRVHSRLRVLG